MSIVTQRASKILRTGILAFAALAVAQADVPRGWILAGSKPAEYEVGVDRETVHGGQPSAFLKDENGNGEGFGTLMQQISAEQYRGKRLRLSG